MSRRVCKACIPLVGLLAVSCVYSDLKIDNTFEVIHQFLPYAYRDSPAQPVSHEISGSEILPDIALSPRQRRDILLLALKQHNAGSSNSILTPYAVKDLKLLSGTTLKPELSLLNNFGGTITVAGEIMLANTLLLPIKDIALLQKRQAALDYLLNHPELCAALEQMLKRFAADEDGLIALFDPSDATNTVGYKDIDEQTGVTMLRGSSTTHEAGRRVREGLALLSAGALPVTMAAQIYFVAWGHTGSAWKALKMVPELTWHIAQQLKNDFSQTGWMMQILTAGGITALQSLSLYQSYNLMSTQKNAYSFVMERSRRPGRALNEAKKIFDELGDYSELTSVLSSFQAFEQFDRSAPLKEITTLLQGSPGSYPGVFEYYTSNMGRYKRSLDLIRQNKNALLCVMQAAGEVDAWLTVTRLIRASRGRGKNPIAFASFEEQASKPSLELKQFWNPRLSPGIAVPSDVTIGKTHPQTVVVTGPNAAGKSTAIDGMAIAALLAQTFGIVPAESARLTPFSLIHTHMDISAEIAAGLSSFKAESVRAIEVMKKVQELGDGEFSLLLMDEIFSSTNPQEGEAGTYGYLKTLGSYSNAVNVCTTHYPKPMLLAVKNPARFQNLHVSADTGADGRLVYDYYLKPGYSTQYIAIRLLEEQGIESEFLDAATDVVRHPEKYQLH